MSRPVRLFLVEFVGCDSQDRCWTDRDGGGGRGRDVRGPDLGAVFFLGVPITVTAGLTFVVQCTDDGTNPSDLGQTAILGIQTKIITSTSYLNFGIPAYATTSPYLNASTGTGANTTGAEVSNGVTLGLTAGLYASTSIQIANASFTANTVVMCKLRRVGMAATDTLAGSILVTGVAVGTY